MKKEFQVCQKENDILKIENDKLKFSTSNESELKQENKGLIKKVEYLTTALARLTQGKENLKILLGSQYLMLDRAGIGYEQGVKRKAFKDKCSKITCTKSPFVTCNYCGRKGHYTHECYAKRKKDSSLNRLWVPKGNKPKEKPFQNRTPVLRKEKKVWVLKGTISNPAGPKIIWVPKYKAIT